MLGARHAAEVALGTALMRVQAAVEEQRQVAQLAPLMSAHMAQMSGPMDSAMNLLGMQTAPGAAGAGASMPSPSRPSPHWHNPQRQLLGASLVAPLGGVLAQVGTDIGGALMSAVGSMVRRAVNPPGAKAADTVSDSVRQALEAVVTQPEPAEDPMVQRLAAELGALRAENTELRRRCESAASGAANSSSPPPRETQTAAREATPLDGTLSGELSAAVQEVLLRAVQLDGQRRLPGAAHPSTSGAPAEPPWSASP